MKTAQLDLFSQAGAKPTINTEAIQKELQTILGAGKLTVKTSHKRDAAASTRYTDKVISISLNPRHIRTQKQLDWVLDTLRADMRRESDYV